MMVAISLPQLFQEHLETSAIGTGEVHTEALSDAGLHSRIQVGPFVYPTYYTRRAIPFRAIWLSMPVYEPEACFVESQNLQRLFRVLLAVLLDPRRELF